MKKVVLKNKKEASLKRKHPWVFSGAIARIEGDIDDGDLVAVFSIKQEILGWGHYFDGSISVRMLSFENEKPTENFWLDKITNSFNVRKSIGIISNEKTNCYRLVNGEGDGLPGLIIDIYDKTAVLQCHTVGMYRSVSEIVSSLQEIYKNELNCIYNKSADTIPKSFGIQNNFEIGDFDKTVVLENSCKFQIDVVKGQKTGFFLDQRINRNTLSKYCEGKNVLNAFCYTGGFSVYALRANASLVHSVDASSSAIEQLEENIKINGFEVSEHQSYVSDVLQFLKQEETIYDLIILDPPAYAKSQFKKHKAVQAYKRLNALALNKLQSGGILFTFSCSRVIDPELFYHTIQSAAIEVGKDIKVIEWLSQGPDHPVSIYHSEGKYLKGLVLIVQ